jgi:hypothetical protein
MPRINLKSDPYDLELYCPFCGEHIIGSEGEGFSETCEHTICVGFDDPGEEEIIATDIVFVAHEGAPGDRDHVFAFREPL